MTDQTEQSKGPLAWFAKNHVAANLLMILILVSGIITIFTIKIEFFPEMSLDFITVTVPYLGASPEEVEQGVSLRVEEAVASIDGIKRLYSTSAEGASMVTLELEEYADPSQVLDDVKAEVDRIITFPRETEKPIITEIKTRYEVLTIVLHGAASERTLKELAENVKDDLTALPNISQAFVAGARAYEISIEISEETLRKHSLSFDEVTRAVRASSMDIPGGSVKTAGGEILVRTKGQRYTGPEFEEVVVLTQNDGTKLLLRDIATVIDGFDDSDMISRFDGRPAVHVKVFRVGQQDALDVANTARKYVEEKGQSLPDGISLDIWQDLTQLLRARLDLLMRNARLGLLLVFLCLTLFLHFRLAFWTTLGIPISFLGGFCLMPLFGVSLNMISLFAFILVLGIVVDDAIVVGENIFTYREGGMDPIKAAILGVQEMAAPVIMAVLTTIFAFVPLMYITGIMGKFLRVIPIIVILVLSISLIEALLILPSHLARAKLKTGKTRNPFARLQRKIAALLEGFVKGPFAGAALFVVRYRYVTLASAIAILITIIGLMKGGFIKTTFMDSIEADNMVATLTMPQGTPADQTLKILKRIEEAAFQVRDEVDSKRPGQPSIYKHLATTIGDQPASRGGGPVRDLSIGISSGHLGEVNIELLGAEERGDISSKTLSNRWRQIVGEVAGVSTLTYMSEVHFAGDPINVELSHRDFDKLLPASEELKTMLGDYNGIFDISDNFEPGKAEIKLSLSDAGRTLGLTLADLARQTRQGFYGDEAQRIQRGKHDVRVMIRYPRQQRKSLDDIENMRIRLPDNTEIPFGQVARVQYGRGYATIRRADQRRVVNVSADVDKTAANADEINRDLQTKLLPELISRYPELKWRFAGEQRERKDSFSSLKIAFPLAMLAIFGLLAVQFKSYVQPLIVMSAIPFGVVGAVMGHVILSFATGITYNVGLLSFFGIVALSGVVVNDSLLMVDLINRERKAGIDLSQVIRDSIIRRFRPIMLTTMTTFCGLMPMMMEKSLQARFLIPMAISLAFGVLFATMITLLLVPSLYMIIEDIKAIYYNIKARIYPTSEPVGETTR